MLYHNNLDILAAQQVISNYGHEKACAMAELIVKNKEQVALSSLTIAYAILVIDVAKAYQEKYD